MSLLIIFAGAGEEAPPGDVPVRTLTLFDEDGILTVQDNPAMLHLFTHDDLLTVDDNE